MLIANKRQISFIATATFTLLVGVFLWRNWHVLERSITILRSAPLGSYGIVALPLMALTFVLAALPYRFLAFRKLIVSQLVLVELAAAFANRLVPAGVGTVGVHGLYLKKQRHRLAEVTVVISVTNLLAFCAHMLLLFIALSVGSTVELPWHTLYKATAVGAALIALVVLVFLIAPVRNRLSSYIRDLKKSLSTYQHRLGGLAFSMLSLLGMTLVYLLILNLAAQSFGVQISLASILVVYTAGVLLGSAVPTPGGFAGVEAGLIGGFFLYGVSPQIAVSIALAFRLVTYWAPMVPGFICFLIVRRRKLI